MFEELRELDQVVDADKEGQGVVEMRVQPGHALSHTQVSNWKMSRDCERHLSKTTRLHRGLACMYNGPEVQERANGFPGEMLQDVCPNGLYAGMFAQPEKAVWLANGKTVNRL